MKCIQAVSLAAIAVALAGCGHAPPKEEVADCTFPYTKERAAQWVCPPHEVAGYKDTGFGSYAKTAAGYQFQLDLASLAARKDLAAQMQARVSAGVKNAIKTVGAPGTPFEMVDQLASSVASQLTEAKLTGSKVVRSATDSKGTLWVVVGMDIQGARQTVQEAVMTSMKTEPAKWQGVSGKRLPSEMQAEVLKMTDAS